MLIFFTALLTAGLIKGIYGGASFQDMMLAIEPYLPVFAVSGVGLMCGLWMVLLPAIGQMSMLVFGNEKLPAKLESPA